MMNPSDPESLEESHANEIIISSELIYSQRMSLLVGSLKVYLNVGRKQ